MEKIDITISATLRCNVLDKTLRSFTKKIFLSRKDYRVIINVDPVGNRHQTQEDVLKIVRKYFNDVIYNFPKKDSFPSAVIWLWSNTSSKYVFHLEDDWEINKMVKMDNLTDILDRYPKICAVRLSKGSIGAGGKNLLPFPCSFCKKSDKNKIQLFPRISLNPSLFRGDFVREASKVMTPTINPESQLVYGWAKKHRNFESNVLNDFLEGWQYSVYTELGTRALVKDIGRNWRRKMRIDRSYDFVTWEKK